MLSLFKKPVIVECADVREVEHVLSWLRKNDYFSNMGKTDYEIIARVNGPLTMPVKIRSYAVVIPYDIASKAMKPFTVDESFAAIKSGSY